MMPDHKQTNQLIRESSPYLLQHAHNPVEWHPWNEKVLSKARSLDKMLLISIGYSACHWCHVMERESFTDPGVAAIMNKHFVCIKVDREERPDVDQVYMNAIQLITGSGGWPLNCFALPDGRPFFGGTYFRKEQWVQLLENIAFLYENRRKELEDQAGSVAEGIRNVSLIKPPATGMQFGTAGLESLISRFGKQFDRQEGGFAHAPKFPMPVNLDFLLDYHYFTKQEDIHDFLKLTLNKMAFGGIYDQVGGGFARYSTDSQWKVPHFEKMLYDNAQMISLYSKAFLAFGDKMYREVVEDSAAFILHGMASPEGGFYSSLDADSEGHEGRFYTWTAREMDLVLGKQSELIRKYYHVILKGTWEHGQNILFRTQTAENFARSQGLQPSSFKTILKPAKAKLLKARNKRPRPGLDNKILTSWNGLMIKGLSEAFLATGNKVYSDAASTNASFLMENVLEKDGRLYHCFNNGKAFINGFLEDYAFFAEGLLALYQVAFREEYLQKALLLADYAVKHFYNEKNGFFFTVSSVDPPLFTRQTEIYDTVMPSSNSTMARVLHILGQVFEKEEYTRIADRMTDAVIEKAIQYPGAFANWASVLLGRIWPGFTVAVAGPDCIEKAAAMMKRHRPLVFYCGSVLPSEIPVLQNRFAGEETVIYVCSGSECKLPTGSVDEALTQIAERYRLTPE